MAKKAAAKPKAGAKAPNVAVTIRMYCQGLGDCFLLTFHGPKPVYVMIDCGVFQGTPDEAKRLIAVAEDIKKATKSGAIDLLIVTHEHWDHIAGFSRAFDVFNGFDFKNVWLSWAEDDEDRDARILKADLGKKKAKVKEAVTHLKSLGLALGSSARDDLETTTALLDFYGPDDDTTHAGGKLAAAKVRTKPSTGPQAGMSLGNTMDWLRSKVTSGEFRNPGECLPLPGLPAVKVYVLGPPRNAKSIRKMDPTGDQGYGFHTQSERVSLLGAIGSMMAGDPKPAGPFEDEHRVSMDDAKLDPFFREFYGFDDVPLCDAGETWRRIDDEWLGGVSRLALQLDTGVNNTSLALAFELPGGRTLIFPGDAQIGNWLSWDDVTFKDEEGDELPVRTKDLLNKAVFYKVGHHGSHNATRKVGGLEEMIGGGLVAMIPTDEAYALTKRPPKTGWKMPFDTLNKALVKATSHRVLRADDKSKAQLKADAGDDAKTAVWKAFLDRVEFAADELEGTKRKLWVEYHVPA